MSFLELFFSIRKKLLEDIMCNISKGERFFFCTSNEGFLFFIKRVQKGKCLCFFLFTERLESIEFFSCFSCICINK